jgi:hypothetical protein
LIYFNNIDTISSIIDLGVKKNYLDFVKLILGSTCDFGHTTFKPIIGVNYSVLNSTLFVVNDLTNFINSIISKGYDVNQGPQP